MFKFLGKLFGFDESKFLAQQQEIDRLRQVNLEILSEVNELKKRYMNIEDDINTKEDIDYDNIQIDYDVLAGKLDVGDISIDLEELAGYVSISDIANNIDMSDLASYLDASEIAPHLNFDESDFVDSVADKVLEKLINNYKAKAR